MSDLGHPRVTNSTFRGPGDAWIANLARRQHGVVALRQLLAAGFSPNEIKYMVKVGRLHRLYRAVYAVGHRVLTREGRWMAAVLACGEGAVLSHREAAAMHGIRRSARAFIDVTAIRGRCRGHRGITLHRVRQLHPEDHGTIDAIPVTSLARTLLDLAEVVRYDRLERAVEESERLGLFDLGAVDRLRARSRGRRGLKPLNAVIADLRDYVPMTRSELERAFLNQVRAAGLPEPAMNVWIDAYEVDAAWLEQRVVVELDRADYHDTTRARRRDSIRDANLQLADYRVIRVSDEWLQKDPDGVVAVLHDYFKNPS